MRKVIVTIVSLVFIIGAVGCSTLPMNSSLDKPVSMTKVSETPVKAFVSQSKAIWLFWGYHPLVMPTIDGIIAPELTGHSGLQNLKITTEYDLVDMLINYLTVGIVNLRTLTVQGEIYDESPPSSPPARTPANAPPRD